MECGCGFGSFHGHKTVRKIGLLFWLGAGPASHITGRTVRREMHQYMMSMSCDDAGRFSHLFSPHQAADVSFLARPRSPPGASLLSGEECAQGIMVKKRRRNLRCCDSF